MGVKDITHTEAQYSINIQVLYLITLGPITFQEKKTPPLHWL